MIFEQLPDDWKTALSDELEQPYITKLRQFLENEYATQTVYPPQEDLFSALRLTPLAQVKVVILGQDPYHNEINGVPQAHGLAFSVRPPVPPPPSLVNMYIELKSDLGLPKPKGGSLEPWAKEGVLLLNSILTVRAHTPASHQKQGWEKFTDAILRVVNEKQERVVFILWGAFAQKKQALITSAHHVVLKSVHPSPLSARNGFFGSQPYSQANTALEEVGIAPVDWKL
ncbi:MAG: uracil-DNA glycosylase [Chthonomonadaceae bacterium]|nr:uracil-DNA glycosylase [Chthonomonadaceae bacterium]